MNKATVHSLFGSGFNKVYNLKFIGSSKLFFKEIANQKLSFWTSLLWQLKFTLGNHKININLFNYFQLFFCLGLWPGKGEPKVKKVSLTGKENNNSIMNIFCVLFILFCFFVFFCLLMFPWALTKAYSLPLILVIKISIVFLPPSK